MAPWRLLRWPIRPLNEEPTNLTIRTCVLTYPVWRDDVQDMKVMMRNLEQIVLRIEATLNATLPHLATKAELADLRTEMRGGWPTCGLR